MCPADTKGALFVQVCRHQRIRTVLAIAANKDWDVHQLHVQTAFVHAEVDEKVPYNGAWLRDDERSEGSFSNEARK